MTAKTIVVEETSLQGTAMAPTQLPQFFESLEVTLSQLASHAEMQRLFHGRGRLWQGLEQLTADWLANHLVIALFKPVSDEFMSALRHGLLALTQHVHWQRLDGESVIIQHRYLTQVPNDVIWGHVPETVIGQELGLNYHLTLDRYQNNGLFLDMRDGRDWVKKQAHGKRVLNLFAYTCGFSVAAVAGGASHVINVDMSKAALARGRDNHRLNQHDVSSVSFLAHDILKSWAKLKKQGPYDLVIIDPPTFQKGSFVLTKDYQKILRRLTDWLAPSGQVLACINAPTVTSQYLIDLMAQEAPALHFVRRLENPSTFADLDEEASLKALVFEYQ